MSRISVYPNRGVSIISPLNAEGELLTAAPSSTEELLGSIALEMRVQSIYLQQLPLVLNAGTNFEDEPETLREEMLNEE